MNKKLIIPFLIILLLAIIAFMANDLFFSKSNQENPYELKTDSLQQNDSNLVCYKEISQIKIDIDEPSGIVIDKNDHIFVAGNKVIAFDENCRLINSFKLSDVSSCITTNSNKEIFVGIKNRIEVWNYQGQLVRQWKLNNTESVLTGIAANDTSVFVANADERVVHQFDLKGKLINNLGAEDTVNGVPNIIIRSPFFDVSLGRDNEIWIVNPGRYSLEAFDNKGKMKSSWGKRSDKIEGFGGCCNPTNIALLSDGSFVTSEKAVPRIKIYTQTGVFSCVVAGPDKFNEGTKGLDLAVDSRNRIYVLDPIRKQIRIFEIKKK
ncbi:MAG: hypothetical protein WCK02_07790 [Bacteroidota bacterium]